MLLWTARVARLDRVRNDSIRQRFGVTPMYLRRCAKLICDGTATSFAQIMTLSERMVLTLMCPEFDREKWRQQESGPRNEAGQTQKKKQKEKKTPLFKEVEKERTQ
ncbi:unnamed protein product [Heligmosomoides polygyrus]|uniref:Replication initiation protein n=1 Tax=Heligmosomoides polygyrus TaxID=6339 RepID=A0A183GQX4_HELPZ|nr:unnamed protein product [Heligmosomoides polygyrus]